MLRGLRGRILLALAGTFLLLSAAPAQTPSPEPYTPPGPPLALGHPKFLGCGYTPNNPESLNFEKYWNQLTPGNAGKWGSVESQRDVMNWTELDASYAFANTQGALFKLHTLVWGAQQPSWINTLSAADQREEIEEWFAAVSARYPHFDYIDVVNEPIRQPPDGVGQNTVNYVAALGGKGDTGWDWVLNSFRLARRYFPTARLVLNEYGLTNSAATTATYVTIIKLLQAEDLIDAVGIQCHAFETRVSSEEIRRNLDTIAATGLPILISEYDVDGPTDQIQLDDYKRLFPLFWEHPAVVGVTLWGYRPGMWRSEQLAYIAYANGAERPALQWLADYLRNDAPVVAPGGRIFVSEGAADGDHVGTLEATDADGFGTLRGWQITGGTGAGVFAINATTGQVTVAQRTLLNAGATPSYSLEVTVGDGRATSARETVTVEVYPASRTRTRFVNISTRAYCTTGDGITIGGFVIDGREPKRVLVRAVGPSLVSPQLQPSQVLLDPTVEVHRGAPVIASNDDWGTNENAAEITSVAGQIGAAALNTADTKSSALLLTLDPGTYSFLVKGKSDTSGIVLLEVYDAAPLATASPFVNIAARAQATTGDGVAIGGFVIAGTVPKQVLLRAIGTSLIPLGIRRSDVLADPWIELHHGPAIIASNDNWRDNPNAAAITPTAVRIGATALAQTDHRSAQLLLTLDPGVYSFLARGGDAAPTGIVLVEVYDAD